MTPDEILALTAELVAIPSVSGNEKPVTEYLGQNFAARGWPVELLDVPGMEAKNLFISFGVPKIVYTTHVDVVPAPERLFQPRFEGTRLFGRGSCDAKGIAATMIGAVNALQQAGQDGFGLLLVIGEEVTGIGAKAAATALQGRGIRYIVNGEPTEGKLAVAHRGLLYLKLQFQGRSAHSGYPELGEDANAKMIRTMADLLNTPLGEDSVMGTATMNPGLIQGGVAGNVVSPSASVMLGIRTVSNADELLARIESVVGDRAQIEVFTKVSPIRLASVPGFETTTVKYMTDIPNFLPLGVECLLYGPGTIHVAHTDEEHIDLADIADTLDGYKKIFFQLESKS